MSPPFRFVRFQEVQPLTLGSWRGFRLYLVIVGPSLVGGLMLFRRPNLGAAIIVCGMVAYYLVACSAKARS